MKKLLTVVLLFACLFHVFADAVQTGAPAPEPILREWIKGKPFTIAEFKDKLPVVLFFWTISENGSKPFSQVSPANISAKRYFWQSAVTPPEQ